MRADPAEQFLNGQLQPSSDDYDKLTKTADELKQENKDLKAENTKWKEMVLQGIIDFYHSLNH